MKDKVSLENPDRRALTVRLGYINSIISITAAALVRPPHCPLWARKTDFPAVPSP